MCAGVGQVLLLKHDMVTWMSWMSWGMRELRYGERYSWGMSSLKFTRAAARMGQPAVLSKQTARHLS